MSRKISTPDVMRARADNYAHHFECYTIAKMFDLDTRSKYISLTQFTRPVSINIFGATDRTEDELNVLIDLANRHRLDCWFINSFYLTSEGWEAFQEVWKNLPELVHIPCVQVGQLVPIVHTRSRQTYSK